MNKILDVSKHQGNIDFFKMKEQGINGVMCRCAYSGYKDSKFEDFSNAANECKIELGAYAYCTWHYSSVSINRASAMIAAESESNKVIAILQSKNITGPVAIDLELESGQSTLLDKEEMTFVTNLYLNKLAKAGYSPILYCSISWLFDKLICCDIEYPLWIAYYHSSGFESDEFPNTKYGALMYSIKNKICMWQYSSHGDGKSFGASSERIDLNHCYTNFGTKTDNSSYDNIKINPGNIYTVIKGDTLTAIANKHGVSLEKLIATNSEIKNPNLINVGQKINIPVAENSQNINSDNNIYVGCTARVRKDAKTFDGKSIASFVFSNTYTVDQIKGNRAVLDLKGLCTPVNIADLIRVN